MNELIRPRIAYSTDCAATGKRIVYTFLDPEPPQFAEWKEDGVLLVLTEDLDNNTTDLRGRTLQSMVMRSEIDDQQAYALAQACWNAPQGFVVLTRSRQEIIDFKQALGKVDVDRELTNGWSGEDCQNYFKLWVWICKPSGAEWDITGSSGHHALEHTLDRCPGWRVYPAHEVAKMFTPAKQEG